MLYMLERAPQRAKRNLQLFALFASGAEVSGDVSGEPKLSWGLRNQRFNFIRWHTFIERRPMGGRWTFEGTGMSTELSYYPHSVKCMSCGLVHSAMDEGCPDARIETSRTLEVLPEKGGQALAFIEVRQLFTLFMLWCTWVPPDGLTLSNGGYIPHGSVLPSGGLIPHWKCKIIAVPDRREWSGDMWWVCFKLEGSRCPAYLYSQGSARSPVRIQRN